MKAKLKNKEAVETFFVFNPFGTWMGLSVVYLLGWNCRNGWCHVGVGGVWRRTGEWLKIDNTTKHYSKSYMVNQFVGLRISYQQLNLLKAMCRFTIRSHTPKQQSFFNLLSVNSSFFLCFTESQSIYHQSTMSSKKKFWERKTYLVSVIWLDKIVPDEKNVTEIEGENLVKLKWFFFFSRVLFSWDWSMT